MPSDLVFYHAPNSRSGGVRVLLEELRAPYRLEVLNLRVGEQRQPGFLAVNPMGKVPAIVHDGAVVTEQVAIFLFLADLFPEAGLAPAVGDPLRAAYLRWLVFYGSCFEPAVVDRAMKREPAPASISPYGDYETTLATLNAHLAEGPWMLGERFSAADLLWGTALKWTVDFGVVEQTPEIAALIRRVSDRPAFKAAAAADAELAALQAGPSQG